MGERKLLFVAFGSLGDIVPLLAVAKKMRQRHDVVFMANEYFRGFAEQHGVVFQSIGSTEDQLAAKESENSTGETKSGRIHRFDNVIGKSFGPAFHYIKTLVDAGQRPVVISHGNLTPAVLACEAFDLPLILTYYSPAHIPHNDEEVIQYLNFYRKHPWFIRHVEVPLRKLQQKVAFDIKDIYNEYRVRFGLPRIPSAARLLWYLLIRKQFRFGPRVALNIVLLPKWFCEPIDPKIERMYFAGFPFLSSGAAPNPELENFLVAHPNPIVFTPGTAVEDVRSLCEQIIPICRKLGAPGIFASKHGKDAFDSIQKSDDVPLLYLDYADFDSLLPRSRCLIHHGGIGTMAQAIKAGIPQIVRPRMYDQPANGIRAMMYGLGGSIAPMYFTPDKVASILLHIENSPLHAERIPYYSKLVREESGVDNCARRIETFLSEKNHEHEAPAASFQPC